MTDMGQLGPLLAWYTSIILIDSVYKIHLKRGVLSIVHRTHVNKHLSHNITYY